MSPEQAWHWQQARNAERRAAEYEANAEQRAAEIESYKAFIAFAVLERGFDLQRWMELNCESICGALTHSESVEYSKLTKERDDLGCEFYELQAAGKVGRYQ